MSDDALYVVPPLDHLATFEPHCAVVFTEGHAPFVLELVDGEWIEASPNA